MNTINEKIEVILNNAVQSVPSKAWKKVIVHITALNEKSSLEASYVDRGEYVSFDPDDSKLPMPEIINALRREMYEISQGRGAWFTATLEVDKNGRFDTYFNYDNMPEYIELPNRKMFQDDLTLFPRDASLVPEWLHAIIAKND